MFSLDRRMPVLLIVIALLFISLPVFSAPQDCSANKIKQVLEPATSNKKSVPIDCHLTLKPTDVVTKQLIFKGRSASNLRLNCNNAILNGSRGTINSGKDMIRIQSEKIKNKWQRPENILISGCRVYGSVRILGIAQNGDSHLLRDSSRSIVHTQRTQQAAPTKITLDRMKFIGQGRIPLYFSPGVTFSNVTNSEFTGVSASVVIYLDAESYGNLIQGNKLFTRTKKRELIAVDGSAGNQIMNNYLMNAEKGGVFLYRNCGEGGTIRHQPPQENYIANNAFQYNRSWLIRPSVWLGSRQGNRFYCGKDNGYNFGSSISNRDYAHNNTVVDNQFVRLEPRIAIRVSDNGNILSNNHLVFRQTAYQTPKPLKLAEKVNTQQPPVIRAGSKEITEIPFGCSVEGNNAGCSNTVSCPFGQGIVALKAACNLENGQVKSTHVNAVPWNITWILRPSEKVWQGSCQIDNIDARQGQTELISLIGQSQINYHCHENDRNGGDCDIKGIIQCQ